jgi:hypothetical protein
MVRGQVPALISTSSHHNSVIGVTTLLEGQSRCTNWTILACMADVAVQLLNQGKTMERLFRIYGGTCWTSVTTPLIKIELYTPLILTNIRSHDLSL